MADKLIFLDGSEVKLCSPELFVADLSACKIQAVADLKPDPSKGKKNARKEDGYSARMWKAELRSPFKKALVLTGLLDAEVQL